MVFVSTRIKCCGFHQISGLIRTEHLCIRLTISPRGGDWGLGVGGSLVSTQTLLFFNHTQKGAGRGTVSVACGDPHSDPDVDRPWMTVNFI